MQFHANEKFLPLPKAFLPVFGTRDQHICRAGTRTCPQISHKTGGSPSPLAEEDLESGRLFIKFTFQLESFLLLLLLLLFLL